jgi:hypothetical protein
VGDCLVSFLLGVALSGMTQSAPTRPAWSEAPPADERLVALARLLGRLAATELLAGSSAGREDLSDQGIPNDAPDYSGT